MKRLLITTFVLLGVLGCSCRANDPEDAHRQRVGKAVAATGAMSTDEFNRITRIDKEASHGKTISDRDIDFLMELYKRPTKDGYVQGLRMHHASTPFKHSLSKQWGKRTSEITAMANAMIHYRYDALPLEKREKMTTVVVSGCLVLGNTGDTAYLTELDGLAKASHEGVAMASAIAVARIRGQVK